MGKCGGHELNYVSDVDVSSSPRPVEGADEHAALRVATQLATHLIKVCSDHTGEGTIWPVDAALRPEGKAGPLVRTLASHVGYYERWAKTWEFQALLKARPVAGDAALGQRLPRDDRRRWCGRPRQREGFVTDVQAMRRRVVEHIPATQADRQIKLGPGGLRDVEFAVQLLQMVHGRADERDPHARRRSRRSPSSPRRGVHRPRGRPALARRPTCSCAPSSTGSSSTAAAHRTDPARTRSRCAGSAGRWATSRTRSTSSSEELHGARREVRRLHEKLFYRPLLDAVARPPGEAPGVTPARRAKHRLAALGYADPEARAPAPRGADRAASPAPRRSSGRCCR